MFPLKLIRTTENGNLQLEGLPLYIAGTVASVTDLPPCGQSMGELYIVENVGQPVLYVWTQTEWVVLNPRNTLFPMTEEIIKTIIDKHFN